MAMPRSILKQGFCVEKRFKFINLVKCYEKFSMLDCGTTISPESGSPKARQ
jgi:hypothetical protein